MSFLGSDPARSSWMDRPVVSALAIALLAGVSALILAPGFVNYDQAFALNWGQDVLGGDRPDYEAPSSPTPHPLSTTVAAVASLVGPGSSETAIWLFTCVAFAAVVWLIFLLTAMLASWPGAVLSALTVATGVSYLSRTSSSFADIWVLALVLAALYLEVRRPRRGFPVLALLVVAGLQRPEAWVLSAAYWLWLLPDTDRARHVRLAAVAAAAPALWMLIDLAVTGDPLFSFVDTRVKPVPGEAVPGEALPGAEIPGDHGPSGVVDRLTDTASVATQSLRETLRLPVLVGGLGGLAAALVLERRRSLIPAAVVVLMVGTFFAFGLASLPLSERFLFPVAAVLAVFFGFAAFGWLRVASGRLRLLWALAGLVLVAATLASVPDRRESIAALQRIADTQAEAIADLRNLAGPGTRGLRDCSLVYVPNYRPIPYLAYYLDRPLRAVRSADNVMPTRGAFVAARSTQVEQALLVISAGRRRQLAPVPETFREVGGNRSWVVYVRGC